MSKALEYLLSRPLLCTPEAAEVARSIVSREGEPQAVESRKGSPVDHAESGMTVRDGVAVIPVCGPIYRYADWMTEMCGGATVETIARDLRLACDNPRVQAILLNVDSPGGEAAGIGELASQISAANAMKPVCAYVGNQGCSAAYWLSAGAGEIVCAEAAMLGSIGVVMGYTKRAPKAGDKSYEWVSSQSPDKRPDPETEAGKAIIQAQVDSLAEVFIENVAKYRGVSVDHVKSEFGKGGVKIGADVVAAGMADEVGDFESTLARLSKGERLSRKPAKQAVKPKAQSPKGKPMAFNPFQIVARLWETDREKVEAAIADEAPVDPGFAAFVAKLNTKPTETPPPVASQDTPAVDEKALRAEIEAEFAAKAKADAEKTVRAFFLDKATAFCADAVRAGKTEPNAVPALTARYLDAAMADHAGPLVYADATGKNVTTTRLSFVEQSLASATPSKWTSDLIPANADLAKLGALPTSGGDDDPVAQANMVAKMLEATPEGKAALAKLTVKK